MYLQGLEQNTHHAKLLRLPVSFWDTLYIFKILDIVINILKYYKCSIMDSYAQVSSVE